MSCSEFFIAVFQFFGLTNLIVIVGFFIAPPLTYYFTVKFHKLKENITFHRSLKKAFFPALQALERSDDVFGNPFVATIINSEFARHEEAIQEFIIKAHLSGFSLNRLNKAWAEYKTKCEQWKQNVDSISAIHIAMVSVADGDKEAEKQLENLLNLRDSKKLAMKTLIINLLDIAKKY